MINIDNIGVVPLSYGEELDVVGGNAGKLLYEAGKWLVNAIASGAAYDVVKGAVTSASQGTNTDLYGAWNGYGSSVFWNE